LQVQNGKTTNSKELDGNVSIESKLHKGMRLAVMIPVAVKD
jgi:hypothetical protein